MRSPNNEMEAQRYIEIMEHLNCDLLRHVELQLRNTENSQLDLHVSFRNVVHHHLAPYMEVDDAVVHLVQKNAVGYYNLEVNPIIHETVSNYDPETLPWDQWDQWINDHNYGFIVVHGAAPEKIGYMTHALSASIQSLSAIIGDNHVSALHGLGVRINTNENDLVYEYTGINHCISLASCAKMLHDERFVQRVFFHEWMHALENRIRGVHSTTFVHSHYAPAQAYLNEIVNHIHAPKDCARWEQWIEQPPMLVEMERYTTYMLGVLTGKPNSDLSKNFALHFMDFRPPARDFFLRQGKTYEELDDDLQYIDRLDDLHAKMLEQLFAQKSFWVGASHFEDYRELTKDGEFDTKETYWSRDFELLARAFEVYAIDKANLQITEKEWGQRTHLSPTIESGDLHTIGPLFDQMLHTLIAPELSVAKKMSVR